MISVVGSFIAILLTTIRQDILTIEKAVPHRKGKLCERLGSLNTRRKGDVQQNRFRYQTGKASAGMAEKKAAIPAEALTSPRLVAPPRKKSDRCPSTGSPGTHLHSLALGAVPGARRRKWPAPRASENLDERGFVMTARPRYRLAFPDPYRTLFATTTRRDRSNGAALATTALWP
jgi:hypothetical protein